MPSTGTHLSDTALGQTLARISESFNKGDISRAWQALEPIAEKPPVHNEALLRRVQFLILGCGLYYFGDLDKAMALNWSLPDHLYLPVRYRMAFRFRDAKLCKKIRRSPHATEKMQKDFACSAAIRSLWLYKYKSGFSLIKYRAHAILFPKIIPSALTYAELPKNPDDDRDIVVLEQGVGDILMYLPHIITQRAGKTTKIVGFKKYRTMIARYMPDAQFFALDGLPKDWHGQECHCAEDYLARHYMMHKNLKADPVLDRPVKEGQVPVIGICWRGGSGQNRREERYIPLQYFLDILPKGVRYLALQFDMTDEEKALLKADARCGYPLMDLTENSLHSMDIIRSLSGVVSVDSANLHFAGHARVPSLALMNKNAHWYWGSSRTVGSVYPKARTFEKDEFGTDVVQNWLDEVLPAWKKRPKTPVVAATRLADRPVFITGLPRSGTSMLTGLLSISGLWTGKTIGPTAANPKGFFENMEMREQVLKGILSHLGKDPRGVQSLPDADYLPPVPHLKYHLSRIIKKQGYNGKSLWGYKDPKLLLVWSVFAKTFPHAHWIITKRDRQAVINSCCKAPFLANKSTSPEFWSVYLRCCEQRLDKLLAEVSHVTVIDTDALAGGDYSEVTALCSHLGLTFDAQAATAFVSPKQFSTKLS